MDDIARGTKPEPLIMSRLFKAPRETVFRAWSTAAHIKRWFCPEGLTIPEAEIDLRTGGVFAVCMRLPDGQDFWSRGTCVEVVPLERIVLADSAESNGVKHFSVLTTVIFAAEAGGTRMSVRQDYEIFTERGQEAVGGAMAGWTSTLNRLEAEVARLSTPAVSGSFTLERVFSAPPARVFHAFIDLQAKSKWFASSPELAMLERYMDVTPGGRERALGRWANGNISCFDAVYFDVILNRRLVYAYEMHLNGEKISVSLATLELAPEGAGTRLVVTEQGSFLDGYEDNGAREHGTGFLLDQLGASLGGAAAGVAPPNCSART